MENFSKPKKEKGGDARIELATSCTQSKNHTTRPITLTHTNLPTNFHNTQAKKKERKK